MKEITILSGKGGTGKTSLSAALASIAKNSVFCDNDVDAPDLHLILQPVIKEKYTFNGSWVANIEYKPNSKISEKVYQSWEIIKTQEQCHRGCLKSLLFCHSER